MLVFLQQVINGLAQGGIYSLIAIGWTTVFGIVGVINWTHGEIYMLGAYRLFCNNLSGTSADPCASHFHGSRSTDRNGSRPVWL